VSNCASLRSGNGFCEYSSLILLVDVVFQVRSWLESFAAELDRLSSGGLAHCELTCLVPCRYFLRKLKKVKKSHGQILSINEVSMPTRSPWSASL
jgi:hypothetical protein